MKKTYTILLAFCLWALGLQAATITVTSINDNGPGSFRQAIIDAAPGDVIDFDVTGTIILAARILIDKDLQIIGPGMDELAISGGSNPQVYIQLTGRYIGFHFRFDV